MISPEYFLKLFPLAFSPTTSNSQTNHSHDSLFLFPLFIIVLQEAAELARRVLNEQRKVLCSLDRRKWTTGDKTQSSLRLAGVGESGLLQGPLGIRGFNDRKSPPILKHPPQNGCQIPREQLTQELTLINRDTPPKTTHGTMEPENAQVWKRKKYRSKPSILGFQRLVFGGVYEVVVSFFFYFHP